MNQLSYDIEILDEPIEFDGRRHEKSVKIVSYYAQKKVEERYLGLIYPEKIYDDIEAGKPINIDNCYVKNFNINEYRKQRKLGEQELVIIHGVSAENAFFDCDSFTDFSYVKFKDKADFDHAIFSHGSLSFIHSIFETETIDFSSCNFHSHQTLFQYAEFYGETLKFEASNFDGELISFINAVLKCKTVTFKRVNFYSGKVKFHFTEFGKGNKIFEKIKFYGSVLDFHRVIFNSGKIDFRRSLFGDTHVTFQESEMTSGKLTFRLATFKGGDLTFRRMDFGKDEANFDHISFGGRKISFESCTADVISIANSDIHATLDLRVKRANVIDLSDTYLHSITDMSFQKPDSLNQLIIKGTRNLGKIIIEWKKHRVRELILNQKDEKNALIAEQFNIIKDNFAKNGQYTDEDWAYVYFKRYELKSNRESGLIKYRNFKPIVHLFYFLKLLVFDKMGLYATSPNRVFISMVFTIIGFGGIYMFFDMLQLGELVNSVGAPDHLGVIDKSLYHSAITFFTIGYGDYYPTGLNRFVSGSEGWVGVFMMSYFTAAFVRKILR
ncbi:MAG: potassium channel family protein [Crocinitomicaceae bacterium]